MGVNTNIYLPPTARVEDFATALAGFIGSPISKKEFGQPYTGYSAEADYPLEVTTTSVIQMLRIGGTVENAHIYGTYHFEVSENPMHGPMFVTGYVEARLPVWQAVSDFFGALVDLDDCDSIKFDFAPWSETRDYHLDAADGKGWEALQDALLEIRPVLGRTSLWNR